MAVGEESLVARVRKRPGMYIGDTRGGSGLHHMLWEVVANALDEHLAGRATRIEITLGADGLVTVEDDGGGMPVHDVNGISFPELALTTLHTSGTLDGHVPHAHVGLYGLGLSVVNALSSSLALDVFREGRHWQQHYEEGIPRAALESPGPTPLRGTRLAFKPDAQIFEPAVMAFELVDARLRELAMMNAGLRVELHGNGQHRAHRYPEGLSGFFDAPGETLCCRGVSGDVRVDVAMRWGAARPSSAPLLSFANNEPTTDHGTHLDGLMRGIADVVLPELSARSRHSARVRKSLTHGLEAVVHVALATPTFSGPVRAHLTSPEALAAVRAVVADQLRAQLDAKPELRSALVERTTR